MEQKKQSNIKILVACHKQDPNIRQDKIYMPIQVGKELHPDLDLGFQCDNTGDNISVKNGSYCELTAIYWAWKNLKNVDNIGLCHYRRYFDIKMTENNILRTLKKFDCIIPTKKILPTNIVSELISLSSWEDVYIFIDELLSFLPEGKKDIFDYFYKNNKFTVCNMFIMNRTDFDEYCRFVFGVLSGTEQRIKKNGYSRLRRVLGYLSEPLLGFWLKYKKKKVLEVPIQNPYGKESLKSKIIGNIRSQLVFNMIKSSDQKNNRFFGDWIVTGLKNDGIELKNI